MTRKILILGETWRLSKGGKISQAAQFVKRVRAVVSACGQGKDTPKPTVVL